MVNFIKKVFIIFILLVSLVVKGEVAIAQQEPINTSSGYESSFLNSTSPELTDQTQEVSLGYTILIWLNAKLKKLLFAIWHAIGEKLIGVFYYIIAFTTISIAISWFINGNIAAVKITLFWVFASFIGKIIIDPGIYQSLFYKPLMSFMMGFPSFVIEVIDPSSASNGNPLLYMFITMDNSIAQMLAVAEEISASGSIVTSTSNVLFGFLLQLIYLTLHIIYGGIILLSVVSVHILQVFVPIALILAIFPPTRSIIINTLRHVFMFAITPTFAAITMAISVELMREITAEATQAVDSSMWDIHLDLCIKAIFIGAISIFFHLKATSFAAMVTQGMGTGFGQLFGAAAASTVALTKMGSFGTLRAGGGALAGAKILKNHKPTSMTGMGGYAVGASARRAASSLYKLIKK